MQRSRCRGQARCLDTVAADTPPWKGYGQPSDQTPHAIENVEDGVDHGNRQRNERVAVGNWRRNAGHCWELGLSNVDRRVQLSMTVEQVGVSVPRRG